MEIRIVLQHEDLAMKAFAFAMQSSHSFFFSGKVEGNTLILNDFSTAMPAAKVGRLVGDIYANFAYE